jgi:hypothetical protein
LSHSHAPSRSRTRRVPGGVAYRLETCSCGALRSVVMRSNYTTTSDWEQPDEDPAVTLFGPEPHNDT